MDPVLRLNSIAAFLGIEFVEPQTIVAQLCEQRKCTSISLFVWLGTEEALEYIRTTYGESYKLPCCSNL